LSLFPIQVAVLSFGFKAGAFTEEN